ncbi:transmembrane gamma-carboxyglutamic acid protein 4 [Pelodytes ibericus]
MHLFNHVCLPPALRYWIALRLMLLGYLTCVAFGVPHCSRHLLESSPLKAHQEVFINGKDAGSFLGRRLLYNQFDFEMFVAGNLERECHEELCNYEEAREIFEDHDATMIFWKGYTAKDSQTSKAIKIDVVGLLTGLISAGTFLVIFGLLAYYWYTLYSERRRHSIIPQDDCECRRISLMSRNAEEHLLQPISLSPVEVNPPTYAQAVTMVAPGDLVPPPPYPGPLVDGKIYRKSFSIPASQEF